MPEIAALAGASQRGLGELAGAARELLRQPIATSATWSSPVRRWAPSSRTWRTSAFVLQSMNGLSPIAYSVDFAANAAGMTVAALLAARLAGRVATRTVILVGQVAARAAGVAMLLVGAVGRARRWPCRRWASSS